MPRDLSKVPLYENELYVLGAVEEKKYLICVEFPLLE